MLKKDLVSIKDWTEEEIQHLFYTAEKIKGYVKTSMEFHPLKGKSLGMMFSKSSTRTRISFGMFSEAIGGLTCLILIPHHR